MKNKKFSTLNSQLFFIFLFFFASCNSTEYPSQNSVGPATVSGTLFEVPLEYDAGENPLATAWGDFNGDNKTDLVVSSPRKQNGITTAEDGTLTFFQKNSASGKFPFDNSTVTPATAEWRQDVISADFTGDNKTDLAVTHTDQDKIKLLRNDGNGNFTDNGSVTVGDVPLHLISGDWNGDNQTDLAVVNRDNGSVSILQNSSGVFSISQTLSVGEHPLRIVSGDWDNDADNDIAVLSKDNKMVEIFLNTSGIFSKQTTTYTVGTSPRDLISGDWDCDGKQDLAVSNSGDNTLSLLYGKSDGGFETPVTAVTSGRGPGPLAAADFDNDGKMDFIAGHRFLVSTAGATLLSGDFSLTLSDNNTARTYGTPTHFAATLATDGIPPGALAISDVDDDAKLDLLITLPIRKKLALLSGKQYSGRLACL